MRACVKCCSPIVVTGQGRGGTNRQHCMACLPTRYESTPVECKQCGTPFAPKSDANVYCSRPCKLRARNPLPPARPCEFNECQREFQPKSTLQRSCSPRHAREAWKERNPERDSDIRRNVYHRRRARKKGGVLGEQVIRSDIAKRDGWTCHLCDEAIPQAAAWPDPLSLSIDHVIPLSKGGLHDPSNVKAAHLRCNVKKGDQVAA